MKLNIWCKFKSNNFHWTNINQFTIKSKRPYSLDKPVRVVREEKQHVPTDRDATPALLKQLKAELKGQRQQKQVGRRQTEQQKFSWRSLLGTTRLQQLHFCLHWGSQENTGEWCDNITFNTKWNHYWLHQGKWVMPKSCREQTNVWLRRSQKLLTTEYLAIRNSVCIHICKQGQTSKKDSNHTHIHTLFRVLAAGTKIHIIIHKDRGKQEYQHKQK